MAFRLDDRWVWDFWFAQDGGRTHLFFLQAPKSLGDANKRHWHVSIGHAVSDDLVNWAEQETALRPAASAAWDDYTTWTGTVLRAPQGHWLMFYTGTSRAEQGLIQRIGLATSPDLRRWERSPRNPVLQLPDNRLYETLDRDTWYEQACRDPWIFPDPDGRGWHMVFTAREPDGPSIGRGVIGHATSDDLEQWTLQPPLFRSRVFAQMEVPQIFCWQGRWYCLFCTAANLIDSDYARGAMSRPMTGTHYLMADHPLGEWRLVPGDFLVGDPAGSLYAGRVLPARDGGLRFMAFRKNGANGAFIGELCDPMPVTVRADGTLQVDTAAVPAADRFCNADPQIS
ncbi:beta-fructofuranosidase [Dyella sp. SG562]|uniref:levansucrase n=1 Tax=Dyella sp. SG562 TaxID=2587017 RepID=UPI00142088F7|nr:levansucrase [Dyella sp. SG562]NII74983.1 beta-fructofuranosidase [Dyella sp. SG562]